MIAAALPSAVLLFTATAPPTSDTSQVFDENTVTPGVAGFVAIILIAIAAVLLAIDMTRRIRRTRYRGEIGAKLDAEERDARAVELDARAASLSDEDLRDAGDADPNGRRGDAPR